MLSATGFESTVPLVDMAQISYFPSQYMGSYAHVALTTQPTDGGYIGISSNDIAGMTRASGSH